jgi:hypothetical protein
VVVDLSRVGLGRAHAHTGRGRPSVRYLGRPPAVSDAAMRHAYRLSRKQGMLHSRAVDRLAL